MQQIRTPKVGLCNSSLDFRNIYELNRRKTRTYTGEIHEQEHKSSDSRTAQGDHTDHERGILIMDYKGNCEFF